MNGYNTYNIKDADRFNPFNYPEVSEELEKLFAAAYLFTTPEKENIIISYLRDHSLHSHWLREHKELCDLVTHDQCPTGHIEALFDACKDNRQFLHSFEEYIRNIEVE
jgi:hypothetical protein